MSIASLTIYIGRDNAEILELLQDGVAVGENEVTRAVLAFGSHVLDTEDSPSDISLDATAQNVSITAGQIPNLKPGDYHGMLTIYDALTPNGLAWADLSIHVREWDADDGSP